MSWLTLNGDAPDFKLVGSRLAMRETPLIEMVESLDAEGHDGYGYGVVRKSLDA